MPWKLTIRSGPKVNRSRFAQLADALDELESRGRALVGGVKDRPLDLKVRRFEPVEQVAARIELAGPERLVPSICAGVDVRGDGSTEAYLGRIRREVVAQRKGETPFRALRRALSELQPE